MKILNKLYLNFVCNKFNYLFLQIIFFVLVLTLNPYDTPENTWGASYILLVSHILLCIFMILRFFFLNFSKSFIVFLSVLSAISIFYNEIFTLLNHFELTKKVAVFIQQNNAESILTILLSIFVILSLTSESKRPEKELE